jgi:anti-anti-sigma factor
MQATVQTPHPTPPRPATHRSPGLTFTVDHHLHYQTCLAATGEIDVATADSLIDAATSALHASTRLLILDLAGVTFCGAAGITALIKIHRIASAAGASLALANVGTPVQHVFDLVHLNGILAALHTPQPGAGPGSTQATNTANPNGHRGSDHELLPPTRLRVPRPSTVAD